MDPPLPDGVISWTVSMTWEDVCDLEVGGNVSSCVEVPCSYLGRLNHSDFVISDNGSTYSCTLVLG